MRNKLVIPVLALLCLFLIACKSEPPIEQPPPDKRSQAEKTEDTDEWIAEFETESIGPRQLESVKSYVRTAYPEWSIRGTVAVYERGSFHCLSLDIAHGADAKTINLISQVFVREDKSTYWKTEPLNAELEHIASILFARRDKDE